MSMAMVDRLVAADVNGRWRVGGQEGELVELRYWSWCGVVWSHREVRGEELHGHVFVDDQGLHIEAQFGVAGICTGYVQAGGPGQGPTIAWDNGTIWRREERILAMPRAGSCMKALVGVGCGRLRWLSGRLQKCAPCLCAVVCLLCRFLLGCCIGFVGCLLIHAFSVGIVWALRLLHNGTPGTVIEWGIGTPIWAAGALVTIDQYQKVLGRRGGMVGGYGKTFTYIMIAFIVLADCSIIWQGHEVPFKFHMAFMCVYLALIWGNLAKHCLHSRAARRAQAEDPVEHWGLVRASQQELEGVSRQFLRDQAMQASPDLDLEAVYAIRHGQGAEDRFGRSVAADGGEEAFRGVRRLYHGAPSVAVKAICAGGFKLPDWSIVPSMYGRGLYFADVPQKSWNFSEDRRFLLMCDVALGRARTVRGALPALSLQELRRPSFGGTVHDSVLAEDRYHGGVLAHREYVVYRTEQVIPRFLLAVRSAA